METERPTERSARKSAQELFLAAFQGGYDDDDPWDAVRELRGRPTPEVFRLAVEYSRSAAPLERVRALDVLAQLGAGKFSYLDESVAIAEELLGDYEPLVVRSAAWALAHLGGDRAISALIRARDNPDPGVRWAVATGVAGSGSDDAIRTLIHLMDDADDQVRDWATFGLGTQRDEDSPQIRDALRSRLNDGFEDVRNEAIWGLARRRDRTGLELLLGRLEIDHWAGDEMAAVEILGLRGEPAVEELCVGLKKLLNSNENP